MSVTQEARRYCDVCGRYISTHANMQEAQKHRVIRRVYIPEFEEKNSNILERTFRPVKVAEIEADRRYAEEKGEYKEPLRSLDFHLCNTVCRKLSYKWVIERIKQKSDQGGEEYKYRFIQEIPCEAAGLHFSELGKE